MTMRLFVVTLVSRIRERKEFQQFNTSMAELAILISNLHLRVLAIEQIPNDAKSDLPVLSDMKIGEEEVFRVGALGEDSEFVFGGKQE